MRFLKKVALYFHRYLGWIFGVVFLCLVFSGLCLLIQPDVEFLAQPYRFRAPAHPGEERLSFDAFAQKFKELEEASFDIPTEVTVLRVKTSNSPRATWYVLSSAKNDEESWIYIAYADPYTGKATSYGPTKVRDFFRFMRKFHVTLNIKPPFGPLIVGFSGFVGAIVLLTGVIRWIPKNRKGLVNGLVPHFRRGWFRALFDVHNVWGFYTALVFSLVLLSGSWMFFGWFRAACDKLIGYKSDPGVMTGMSAMADPDSNLLLKIPGHDTIAGMGGARGGGRLPKGLRDSTATGFFPGASRPAKSNDTQDSAAQNEKESASSGAGTKDGGVVLQRVGAPKAQPAKRPTRAEIRKLMKPSDLVGPYVGRSSYGDGSGTGVSVHTTAEMMTPKEFRVARGGKSAVSIDAILEKQKALAPLRSGYDVCLPIRGTDAPVTIRESDGFFTFFKKPVFYWNPYDGELIGRTGWSDLSRAEKIRSFVVPIHCGTIFGDLTRYLLAAICVMGLGMGLTGYYLLIKRKLDEGRARRNKRTLAARRAAESASREQMSEVGDEERVTEATSGALARTFPPYDDGARL